MNEISLATHGIILMYTFIITVFVNGYICAKRRGQRNILAFIHPLLLPLITPWIAIILTGFEEHFHPNQPICWYIVMIVASIASVLWTLETPEKFDRSKLVRIKGSKYYAVRL